MVGEDGESFHLPHDGREHNGRIGHSLDITDIWPVNVEQFQYLPSLFNDFFLVLDLLAFPGEGTVEILLNLDLDRLLDPAFLPPLEELNIELPSDGQVILKDHRPDGAPQFIRNKLPQQILSLMLKCVSHKLLIIQILVDKLFPDGTLILLKLRVLPFP